MRLLGVDGYLICVGGGGVGCIWEVVCCFDCVAGCGCVGRFGGCNGWWVDNGGVSSFQ